MNRTQIYLDEEQTARLDRRAAAEGTSRSMVIRQAVDVYLSAADGDAVAWQSRWKEALERTAGIAPYLGGDDGGEYVEDLRRADAERLSGLTR
jgi:predicted transcriptional regulator